MNVKLTEDFLKDCVAWIEKNGLYPQPGGASIKTFRAAMGISKQTYNRWRKQATFSKAVAQANQLFKQETTVELYNALKRRAEGFTASRSRLTETGVMEDGKMKTKKAIRITEDIVYPPDTSAAKFLITNLDPENWKDRRTDELDGNVDVGLVKPRIVFRDPEEETDGE